MALIYSPDMTVVEICSGVAPAARACLFCGLWCISIDNRNEQNINAVTALRNLIQKFPNSIPVCNRYIIFILFFWFLKIMIIFKIINNQKNLSPFYCLNFVNILDFKNYDNF